MEKIIICLSCKNETDNWDWVHDAELGKLYGICMICIFSHLKFPDQEEEKFETL